LVDELHRVGRKFLGLSRPLRLEPTAAGPVAPSWLDQRAPACTSPPPIGLGRPQFCHSSGDRHIVGDGACRRAREPARARWPSREFRASPLVTGHSCQYTALCRVYAHALKPAPLEFVLDDQSKNPQKNAVQRWLQARDRQRGDPRRSIGGTLGRPGAHAQSPNSLLQEVRRRSPFIVSRDPPRH